MRHSRTNGEYELGSTSVDGFRYGTVAIVCGAAHVATADGDVMWTMALVGRSCFAVRVCVFVLGGCADPAALQDLATVKMLVLQPRMIHKEVCMTHVSNYNQCTLSSKE